MLKLLLIVCALLSFSCGSLLNPEDKLQGKKNMVESNKLVKELRSFSGFGDDIIKYMSYRLIESRQLLELGIYPRELLKMDNKNINIDGCQSLKSYNSSDKRVFFSIESVNCRPRVCLNTKKTKNCNLFPQHVKKTINALDRFEIFPGLEESPSPERVSYVSGKYNVTLKGLRDNKLGAQFSESRHLEASFIGLDKKGLARYDVFYEVKIDDIEQNFQASTWKVKTSRGSQKIYVSAIFDLDLEAMRVVNVHNVSLELQGKEPFRQVEDWFKGSEKVSTENYSNEMRVTMHTVFMDKSCSGGETKENKECSKQKMDHPIVMDLCGMEDNQWKVQFEGHFGELLSPMKKYRSYRVPPTVVEVARQEGICGPRYKPARNIIHYGLVFFK